MTRASYWQVAIDDLTLDGAKSNLCGLRGCQVAVDTGTSMLAGPTDLIEKFRHRIDVASDCSNYDTLPVLGFKLGNRILNLRPSEYVDNDQGRFLANLYS